MMGKSQMSDDHLTCQDNYDKWDSIHKAILDANRENNDWPELKIVFSPLSPSS
jgi:hypothetical protein